MHTMTVPFISICQSAERRGRIMIETLMNDSDVMSDAELRFMLRILLFYILEYLHACPCSDYFPNSAFSFCEWCIIIFKFYLQKMF